MTDSQNYSLKLTLFVLLLFLLPFFVNAQEVTIHEASTLQTESFAGDNNYTLHFDYADLLTYFSVASIDRVEIPFKNSISLSQLDWDCSSDSGLDYSVSVIDTGDSYTNGGNIMKWYSFDSTGFNSSCTQYTSQNFNADPRPSDGGQYSGLLESSLLLNNGTGVSYPVRLYRSLSLEEELDMYEAPIILPFSTHFLIASSSCLSATTTDCNYYYTMVTTTDATSTPIFDVSPLNVFLIQIFALIVVGSFAMVTSRLL